MRRSFLARWMSTFGLFAVVVSIGTGLPEHSGGGHLLYLATGRGVTVVDSSSGNTTLSARDALPTGDWSLVVRARPEGPQATQVEAVEPATGTVLRTQRLDGALNVRAVSRAGDLVALMPVENKQQAGEGLYRPVGRDHSRIVLSRIDGTPAHVIDLAANVEPEAFSTDGTALFVIQYSPPLHPDRYRVRRLDLQSEQLNDVYTTDKELQTDMRGIARTQVLARDGSRLYTLYTKSNGEAFVHVLSLDQQFANCVDLPKGFGSEPGAMAITTTTDGSRIVVIDGSRRKVAEISDATLHVIRSGAFTGLRPRRGGIVAAAAPGKLFVGRGRTVVELYEGTFRPVRDWTFGASVQALHLGTTGVLFVAGSDRITAIDPRGSARPRSFEVATRGIRTIGDSLPATSKGSVNCAC